MLKLNEWKLGVPKQTHVTQSSLAISEVATKKWLQKMWMLCVLTTCLADRMFKEIYFRDIGLFVYTNRKKKNIVWTSLFQSMTFMVEMYGEFSCLIFESGLPVWSPIFYLKIQQKNFCFM